MHRPVTIKTQLQQQGPHKSLLNYPAPVIQEVLPLSPTGHLLHKATLPRLEVIADLPNTKYIGEKKETQRGSQN